MTELTQNLIKQDWDYCRYHVGDKVRNRGKIQVWNKVRDQVWMQIRDEVGGRIWDRIEGVWHGD